MMVVAGPVVGLSVEFAQIVLQELELGSRWEVW
jgi:hypothetical protein